MGYSSAVLNKNRRRSSAPFHQSVGRYYGSTDTKVETQTIGDERMLVAIEVGSWRDSHGSLEMITMKLEVVVIPVADVERARNFYARLGWRLDADFVAGDAFRVVQFTPPGSACSIHLGKGLTTAPPGSAQNIYLVVSDIEAARAELIGAGVAVTEVFHRVAPGEPAVIGRHPQALSYTSFVSFRDPDGNSWLVQEITARLPGRVAPGVTFASARELATALRRSAAAHGDHERRTPGQKHDDWPEWYAEYLVREPAGDPPPV